ncbi:MAG TPA: SGNH/GDSL hydrolase family protein [Bacteroidia bacterium]|nr:SGNH/GDSL hydrolase family protein [Bacteroidia bacterium]
MLYPKNLPSKARRLFLAASALALLAGCLAFMSTSKQKSADSIRFLALGDSYTIGESVDADQSWPMQLRARLMEQSVEVEWYKIIARTGWKTKDLKDGIQVSSPDANYNLVGLLIGVNDFFQGRGLDEYRQRFQGLLETAIKLAGGRKERVFVISIPDYSYTPLYKSNRDVVSGGIDDFNSVNKKVTLAAGVQYFDITPISRQGLDDPALVASDGLHPSGKQYTAWVKLMEPTILKMLENCIHEPPASA